MNSTPQSERIHIGIFGRTNSGKSSLINAMTGQEISIVSEIMGTTTDPVSKSMEILPLGAVTIFDTAGLDDTTTLSSQRIARTMDILRKTDIVLLVCESESELCECEKALLQQAKGLDLNIIIVLNKSDIQAPNKKWEATAKEYSASLISVSSLEKTGINELKELIAVQKGSGSGRVLISDLVHAGDVCILVVPIDSSAPKGRLILPQQQVIRELIECGASALVTRDTEYESVLKNIIRPALVITDSQVFGSISTQTPDDILLTSFSILFARYKGNLDALSAGAKAVDTLKPGNRVLISEGCTHHRQCEDIGTVKIPKWLTEYTKCELDFSFTSGGTFPDDLSSYSLIVHCGGCMLNEREMKYRLQKANAEHVPIINYGILIAHINGILKRSLIPFCK